MNAVNLLFLAPHWRVALIRAFSQARDALGNAGAIVGADSDPDAPALKVCDAVHGLPPFADATCIEALLKICQREAVTAILPQSNKAVEFLDRHRDAFADPSILAYLQTPETIATCHDKLKLAEFLREQGIAAPHTLLDEKPPPQFPLIAKPRRGEGGKHTVRIENAEELDFYARKYPGHLIQQYVEGREFTVDWFSDRNGKPLCVVPRERLAVRGGEVMVSRIRLDPAIIEATTVFGKRLRLAGPCNLQGIRAQSGEFMFTDVNLRFGSGTVHTIEAGGAIPQMMYNDLAGEAVAPPNVRDGSMMMRYIDAFFTP